VHNLTNLFVQSDDEGRIDIFTNDGANNPLLQMVCNVIH